MRPERAGAQLNPGDTPQEITCLRKAWRITSLQLLPQAGTQRSPEQGSWKALLARKVICRPSARLRPSHFIFQFASGATLGELLHHLVDPEIRALIPPPRGQWAIAPHEV